VSAACQGKRRLLFARPEKKILNFNWGNRRENPGGRNQGSGELINVQAKN